MPSTFRCFWFRLTAAFLALTLLLPTPAAALTLPSEEIGPPLLGASTVETVAETTHLTKELALDTIAYTIVNAAITTIVRNVVAEMLQEIEGIADAMGGVASASFVTNLKALMRGVAEQSAYAALRQAGFDPDAPGLSEAWCNPFSGGTGELSLDAIGEAIADQVRDQARALGEQVRARAEAYLERQIRQVVRNVMDRFGMEQGGPRLRLNCSLSRYSYAPGAFMGGDFSQGGWPAWMAYVRGNNPIALRLQLEQEVSRSIAENQATELKYLEFGSGFYSPPDVKQCFKPDGTTVVLSLQEVSIGDCIRVSPGAIIKNQLERALGVDLDRLLNADELNEFLAQITVMLVNQMMHGGGLLGARSSGGGGGKGFLAALEEREGSQLETQRQGLLNAIDAKIGSIQTLAARECGSSIELFISSDPLVGEQWRTVDQGEVVALFSGTLPNFRQFAISPNEVIETAQSFGWPITAGTLLQFGIASGKTTERRNEAQGTTYLVFRGGGSWTDEAVLSTFGILLDEENEGVAIANPQMVWRKADGSTVLLAQWITSPTSPLDSGWTLVQPEVFLESPTPDATAGDREMLLAAIFNTILTKHFAPGPGGEMQTRLLPLFE